VPHAHAEALLDAAVRFCTRAHAALSSAGHGSDGPPFDGRQGAWGGVHAAVVEFGGAARRAAGALSAAAHTAPDGGAATAASALAEALWAATAGMGQAAHG
jgi:hypothetical protein